MLLEGGPGRSDMEYCVEKCPPFEAGGVFAISGERLQALAEIIGIPVWNELFDLAVGALPHGNGTSEQTFALGGEDQNTVSAIGGVLGNLDQPSSFQGLQSRGEGGPIHGEQRGHGAHRRRFRPIQRHKQGKLSIGQPKGTQDFIESPRQGASRALHMEAEAVVPNQKGGFIRQFFRA